MLITTNEQFRSFYPANAGLDMSNLLPYISQAEMKYLLPVLGQQYLSELDTQVNGSTLSAANQLLYDKYIGPALAYYALHSAVPFLMTQVSNLGIQEVAAKEGSTTNIRQWVMSLSIDSLISMADEFIEQALAFLIANTNDYPTWATNALSAQRSLVINNGNQLAEYITLSHPRRTYLTLRSRLANIVEPIHLRSVLGDDLFTAIKAAIAANNPTSAQSALLPYVRRYAAWQLLRVSLAELQFKITSDGVRFIADNEIVSSRNTAQSLSGYDEYKSYCSANCDAALKSLKDFLSDNIDDYPQYEGSDADDTSAPITNRYGDSSGGTFMAK